MMPRIPRSGGRRADPRGSPAEDAPKRERPKRLTKKQQAAADSAWHLEHVEEIERELDLKHPKGSGGAFAGWYAAD
jgi:inhibitor of KinA sporulation pathway (predicted exonuclease)